MALNLSAARFTGPALPEPFVKFDLEKILNANGLLPKNTGEEGKNLKQEWDTYRRWLRSLGANSGRRRVLSHVIEPLLKPELLGYTAIEESEKVTTREGKEDGGFILKTSDSADSIRVWTVDSGTDLESPVKRGHAYRYSYVKIAQRVLLSSQEKIGIITDGQELRILLSDSARPDSQVIISMDSDWRRSQDVPDTFRFLLALACPKGLKSLQEITDKARLKQSTITKELRTQARRAIESFIQSVLDDPQNKALFTAHPDKDKLAKELWHEGLVIVYRLLFVLKGEATDDPAKAFRFTGAKIWRSTYSPTTRLAKHVRKNIDEHADTGTLISTGLKTIFKMFEHGVTSSELNINPLAGTLFEEKATPFLSATSWPEKGCAILLDKLLWTSPDKKAARQRIHYGSLDIEDLGRVYEALLELEPGIAKEPMCRLRRAKLEVVVPAGQGEKYKAVAPTKTDGETEEVEEEELSKGTPILWIEEIKPTQFYLRVGLGRKATGSYYTPHSFVRFLVQETLGVKIEGVSPKTNPFPNKILQLKVIDPAMGSGHFLVEACRFIGDKLYEAVRLCDEKAMNLEKRLSQEKDPHKHKEIIADIEKWRNRILEIPDPDDEILAYLPSRAPEDGETGFSQSKAMALCKRLAAVHCLYGVDKNPLAVELAKLSLWLESQSEGLPLTFLDHRFVVGDSITGPFFEHLLKNPSNQEPIDGLFAQGLTAKLTERLKDAIAQVHELEKSVGISTADIREKRLAKTKLEEDLLPFKVLAAAWAGLVMLGSDRNDYLYSGLLKAISTTGRLPEVITDTDLTLAIAKGMGIEDNEIEYQGIISRARESQTASALSFDLTFPEVFFEITEKGFTKKGFDVVFGNPPWDRMLPADKEFFASYDIRILDSHSKKESEAIAEKLLSTSPIKKAYEHYISSYTFAERIISVLYKWQTVMVGDESTIGKPDLYRLFLEKGRNLLCPNGVTGVVVPSAFHANEGATGVRQLYLQEMDLKKCFSFENKNKLFEIDSRFKFALIIAQNSKSRASTFDAAFYLHDDAWLFIPHEPLKYNLDFVIKTGGMYLSFVELRSKLDLAIIEKSFSDSISFSTLCNKNKINLGRELNVTDDRDRVVLSTTIAKAGQSLRNRSLSSAIAHEGFVPVHEGKTFHQFTDCWGGEPTYSAVFGKLDKANWQQAIQYYRPVVRKIASSTNERTSIWAIIPPGFITNNSCHASTNPALHSNALSLAVLGLGNAFVFDFFARQQVGANLNLFILHRLPVARKLFETSQRMTFLSHSALRLSSNHEGFESLWREQLATVWRESDKKPFAWPAVESEAARWEVRSAIDAIVADSYDLTKEQYEHVLNSFDRASGLNPYIGLCLAKFEELKSIGLEEFIKKYDPYWDIPLNDSLPKPAINLPIQAEPQMELFFGVSTVDSAEISKKSKRSKNK